MIQRYCDAWNRGDLDAIFVLFAEKAVYEGVSTQLIGREAIRRMYARTFTSGEAKELVARPITRIGDANAVGIYNREKCVAVKAFDIANGLIVRQSMRT